MFQTLHIQGYRRFKDYRLENLARVNLLVGDNNSGKTSVLEAVHLLALSDPHSAFRMAAERRGELAYRGSKRNPEDEKWYPTLTNCFLEHELVPGKSIRVASFSDEDVAIDVEVVDITETPPSRLIGGLPHAMGIRFQAEHEPHPLYFGIDVDGAFDSTTTWDSRRLRLTNSIFLDAEVWSMQLRAMWDHVNQRDKASQVLDALKAVVEEINRIHFDAVAWPPVNPRTGVRAGTSDRRELVPIGSFGQGVYRMLELAVGMVAAEGGIFLVDEIDNGFHWSRMAEIWKFVIETAMETNTQVFATTHSEDCIKGLASVCSEHPKLAEEVSVQSLKTLVDFAIDVPGERLPSVVGNEIEVR